MTTLVLGLDGASFELLQPWMDEGSLPNLRSLAERGVATDMQSCLPPVTCPNWQCYATGTNPGKLGVFWWEAVDRKENTIENTSASTRFDGTHYWTLLPGQSAVVNLPTSYPPPTIDGIHVSGGPGAEQTGYATPDTVETELAEQFGYQIHPERTGLLSSSDTENECIDEIYNLIEMRFDAAEAFLEDGSYELLHLTVFYINVLQHFYWDHVVVKEAWRRIDRRVGRLVEREDVETVFVMSDHGANEIRHSFRINAWLEQEGYLVRERGVSDVLHGLGLTKERVRPLLARFQIEWLLRRLVPDTVQQLLPDDDGSVDKSAKANVVDWDASTAVASGQGPVYVLAENRTERNRIAAELANKLEGHSTPDGELLVQEVCQARDLYDGPYVADGPDLVLRQAPGVHIEGRIGTDSPYGRPGKWRGENKETGLFMATGDCIDSDARLDDIHITDIAPTILHLHGQPVPEVMDGRVRTDLYASDTPAAETSVTRRELGRSEDRTDEEEPGTAVSSRLEDLGYLE